MASNMFIKFENPAIDGDSTASDHSNEIEVTVLEPRFSQPTSPVRSTAGGGTVEQANHSNFTFTKYLDSATDDLLKLLDGQADRARRRHLLPRRRRQRQQAGAVPEDRDGARDRLEPQHLGAAPATCRSRTSRLDYGMVQVHLHAAEEGRRHRRRGAADQARPGDGVIEYRMMSQRVPAPLFDRLVDLDPPVPGGAAAVADPRSAGAARSRCAGSWNGCSTPAPSLPVAARPAGRADRPRVRHSRPLGLLGRQRRGPRPPGRRRGPRHRRLRAAAARGARRGRPATHELPGARLRSTPTLVVDELPSRSRSDPARAQDRHGGGDESHGGLTARRGAAAATTGASSPICATWAAFAEHYPKVAGRWSSGPTSRRPARRAADRVVRLPDRAHPAEPRRRVPEIADRAAQRPLPALPEPLPSMAIAALRGRPPAGEAHQRPRHPAAHAAVRPAAPGRALCRFRTCYPVTLWPIEVAEAVLRDAGPLSRSSTPPPTSPRAAVCASRAAPARSPSSASTACASTSTATAGGRRSLRALFCQCAGVLLLPEGEVSRPGAAGRRRAAGRSASSPTRR